MQTTAVRLLDLSIAWINIDCRSARTSDDRMTLGGIRSRREEGRGKERTKKKTTMTMTKGVWIVFWALTSVMVTIDKFNFSLTSLLEFSFTKWELTLGRRS